ncbi:MAG: hypothetical protein RIQ40_926, partial [Planctomycetota bacterium]
MIVHPINHTSNPTHSRMERKENPHMRRRNGFTLI